MKRTLILVLSIFALNAFVYSQTMIGVIDAQKIFVESKKGTRIQTKLANLSNTKQAELRDMQEIIKKLEIDLRSPVLNQETREKKSIELQEKRTFLKRRYEDAQRVIQLESQKQMEALERELMPLIQNYGKSRGFSIIFDSSRAGIVYLDTAIDITDDMIEEVDNKFPN